jgi:flotillin
VSIPLLFGQLPEAALWIGAIGFALLIVIFLAVMVIAKCIKRCPSNRVLVIYGKTGKGNVAKTVHGGAAFVVPLIQDYAYLSLEPMQIEIPLRGALSMENIRVNVPSVFTVAIGTEPEVMPTRPSACWAWAAGDSQAGRGNHLRPVAAGDRLDGDRRDQPRPRHVPRAHSALAGAGTGQDRAGADQRQHHRHHRRVGLHRRHRPEGGFARDSTGPRRRGRQREDGRDPRRRAPNATRRFRWPTPARAARSARGPSANRRCDVAELEKEQTVGEQQAAFEREAQVKTGRARECAFAWPRPNAAAIDGENLSQAKSPPRRPNWPSSGPKRIRSAKAASAKPRRRCSKCRTARWPRRRSPRRNASRPKSAPKLEAPAKAEKARIIVDAEAEAERKRIDAQAKPTPSTPSWKPKPAASTKSWPRRAKACGIVRVRRAKEAFQLLMLEHLDNLAERAPRRSRTSSSTRSWSGRTAARTAEAATRPTSSAAWPSTLPPMMQVMKDIGGIELPESLQRYGSGNS